MYFPRLLHLVQALISIADGNDARSCRVRRGQLRHDGQPSSYTLAFTCQATLDNPDQADTTAVKFTLTPIKTGITVVAKQTTTVDIP